MKRTDYDQHIKVERPVVDRFLAEVVALQLKYGLSISHEDGHGAFIICPHNDHDAKWLLDAVVKGIKGDN